MWRKQEEPKTSPPPGDLATSAPPTRVEAPAAPLPAAAGGTISSALSVRGEVTGRDDLFVDGQLEGSIHIPDGVVTIGAKGRVSAEIEAREIVVRGEVQGTLRGRERVRIGASGRVIGNAVTRRIAIEEGAIFRGKIEVVRAEESGRSRIVEVADSEPEGVVSLHARDFQS